VSTSDAELRVLMLGPLGPSHVESQAIALEQRGVDVHVGGNAAAGLDDSVLEQAGILVSRSPDRGRSTPWGMAATTGWARGLIRELRPDVVHAHWLPGFGLAAALAGASPLALTAWGSDVYRAGRVMGLANRFALRRADYVMADSQDLLDRCGDLGADPSRTALIQWGVDLTAFTPAEDRAQAKEKLGLGPGPLILSPRSLMPVYNIPTIVEAFARVGDARSDAQLVLKHMGAASVELPELPHRERVRVVERVPYEVMADYYRAADVCVSITSSDSSPRSVWEAMACGAPCLLSDLPWVHELIEVGRDALTVPIQAGAVAAEILRLLDDPELSRRLSRNGRALVDTHLNQALEMDRLVKIYRSLADSGSTG
jgi:glycosyltransferase involved in cell wall biosynthesis